VVGLTPDRCIGLDDESAGSQRPRASDVPLVPLLRIVPLLLEVQVIFVPNSASTPALAPTSVPSAIHSS
jgi:hypothetical protein